MNILTIKNVLIAAGLMNIFGVCIFSKLFTNTVLNDADSVVMSNFGLVMIIIWGGAYIAAAFVQANIQWLLALFAVEKLIYVLVWLNWLLNNSLSAVYDSDIFAGIFYSIYGLNDLVFMVLFALFAFSQHRAQFAK